jgi:hypothetical protein
MSTGFGGIPSAKKTYAAFLAYAGDNGNEVARPFHILPYSIAIAEGIPFSITYVYGGYDFAIIHI